MKFIDGKGNVESDDIKCLLRVYDAAHLRIHGEEILDRAIISTKKRFQSAIEHLETDAAKEVRYALETPLFRRLERVEARRYISTYENKTTRNETILEFAKLDFNILLNLYCDELKSLTM